MAEQYRDEEQLKAAHMAVMLAIKDGFRLLPLDMYDISLDRSSDVPIFTLSLRSDLTDKTADLKLAMPGSEDDAKYRGIEQIERSLAKRGLSYFDHPVSREKTSYATNPAIGEELRSNSRTQHELLLGAIALHDVALTLNYISVDGQDTIKEGKAGLRAGVLSPVLETDHEAQFLNLASIDLNVSRYHAIKWQHMLDAITSEPIFPDSY